MATKGQSEGRARGYDAPAEVDVLERSQLARAIADVVSNTPPDFGVRVGLFGEWGSGKTSVLNFARKILEARDHIVIEFSPWGVSDPAELWTHLAQRLLEQLEEQGTKPGTWLGRWKLKHDGTIKIAIQTAKETLGKISPMGSFSPVVDEIRKLLGTTAKQLTELAKGSERIAVLIDDVDRADPRLVPPILFALRELFDVPRFSWILAIDPVVVRAALKQHHPGFGLGRDFLEKIVDFPFVLRDPDPTRRAALVKQDLATSGVQVDGSGVDEIAHLLPGNPRELRAIVRNLRSMASTISRLGPDELDHRLLLALVVIHAAAPNLLRRTLESRTALTKITALGFTRDEEKALAIAKKRIRLLLAASDVRGADKSRMRDLLLHLGEGGLWAAETVIATGRLLDMPPIMTAREANEALAETRSASDLRGWLERFSAKGDRSVPEVRAAFFDQLLAEHSRAMDRAIESFSADDVAVAAGDVLEVVRVIDVLIFELEAVSDLGAPSLAKMYRAFAQWAHFLNPPEYLPARGAESAILLRFANAPGLDAVEALGQIDAWRMEHPFEYGEDERRKRLAHDLLAVLERRATESFIKRLDLVNAVTYVGRWSKADRFLVRGRALIWTLEFRPQLRTALAESGRSAARSDNAMDLLTLTLERSSEAQPALLDDADLVQLLWQVATAIPPNMRRFQSFAKLRAAIQKASNQALAEPSWWQAKKAQYEAAVGSQADTDKRSAAGGEDGEDPALSADGATVVPDPPLTNDSAASVDEGNRDPPG